MKEMIKRVLYCIKTATVNGFQIVRSASLVPCMAVTSAITISTITLSVGLSLTESANHNSYPDFNLHSKTTAMFSTTTGEISSPSKEWHDTREELKWILPVILSGTGFRFILRFFGYIKIIK